MGGQTGQLAALGGSWRQLAVIVLDCREKNRGQGGRRPANPKLVLLPAAQKSALSGQNDQPSSISEEKA